MDFFRLSAGRWRSQRIIHHLAFKQAELGDSEITVQPLELDDPQVKALCQFHKVDYSLAAGGCQVIWQGSMSWDKSEEENHEGQTVFALVPNKDNIREGRLLRDRGYVEIVPIVGYYHLDEEDALVLTTDYETMSTVERFWFVSPDLRMRTSTVKRFGGLSSASCCTETRILAANGSQALENPSQPAFDLQAASPFYSSLGW